MLKKILYMYIMSYYAEKWNHDYAIRRRKIYEYILREGAARLGYKRVKSMIWDIIYNEPKLASLCFDIPEGRVGTKDLLFEFTDYSSVYFNSTYGRKSEAVKAELVNSPKTIPGADPVINVGSEKVRIIFEPQDRPVLPNDPQKHLYGYGVKFTVMDELGRTGTSYKARR